MSTNNQHASRLRLLAHQLLDLAQEIDGPPSEPDTLNADTWVSVYYPETAQECAQRAQNLPPHERAIELLEHARIKWMGLRRSTLALYSIDGPPIEVSAETCSLCVSDAMDDTTFGCHSCPLYHARGKIRCTTASEKEQDDPYSAYQEQDDPEPMIAALTAAIEWARANLAGA